MQGGIIHPKIRYLILSLFSDPDVTSNDGVYSRYLTDFDLGEGRYEVTVFVDDNAGRAFSFQKERSKLFRSCMTLAGFRTQVLQFLNSS